MGFPPHPRGWFSIVDYRLVEISGTNIKYIACGVNHNKLEFPKIADQLIQFGENLNDGREKMVYKLLLQMEEPGFRGGFLKAAFCCWSDLKGENQGHENRMSLLSSGRKGQ